MSQGVEAKPGDPSPAIGRADPLASRPRSGSASPTRTSGGSARRTPICRLERTEKGVVEIMPPAVRGNGCEERRC